VSSKGVFSLHWTSGPPRTGRSRLMSDPPEMEWRGLFRSTSDAFGRPTVCLPETKWVRCPTHQPIKCSSTKYLAAFTHFRSHTRIIGRGNLFDFAKMGAFTCSSFSRPKWISIAKSAKLCKSATDPQKHLSLSVAVRDRSTRPEFRDRK